MDKITDKITCEEFVEMFEILKNDKRIVYSCRNELKGCYSFIRKLKNGSTLELQFPFDFGGNAANSESVFAIVKKSKFSTKEQYGLIYVKIPYILQRDFYAFLSAKRKKIYSYIKRKEHEDNKKIMTHFKEFLELN